MNTTASSHENQPANEKPAESTLECNICFEDSTEPVTTTCGHIYCWSCIYKWLHSKANNNYCPVCQNVISEEKIIPLYTKNNTHSKRKADENIPKRPQQEREERKENDPNRPPNANNWFNFMSNPVFNAFFAGINIRSPNMAINIGFPTLIPMLIIYLFNFLSSFLTSDPTQSYNPNQQQSQGQRNTGGNSNYGRSTGGSNAYNSRASASTAAMVEDDYSMPKFILMLLLCIGLPMLVRRIMRS